MGRGARGGFIDLRDAGSKPGFIEQTTLDAAEYLAALGMTSLEKTEEGHDVSCPYSCYTA